MKKPIYVLIVLAFVLSGCSKDVIDNPITNKDIATIDLKYAEADTQSRANSNQELNIPMDPNVCFRTQLLDSKLETMGYADFALVEGDIVITFKTDGYWKLVESYLDVIECTGADFPLDANGNPDMSVFKYSSYHKNPVKRVDYFLDQDDISDSMCFAAFAKIADSYGNTMDVWAHGWEMYTPAYQKGCLPDEIEGNFEDACSEASDIEFYIPLQSSTSGVYPVAGTSADSVVLKSNDPTSEGYVDIDLIFSEIPNNFKDAAISISFYDLDLYTDIIESNGRVISFAE
ncbi:MAG: hypothetical protein KJO77_04425, partial [Bacteroidia bacterium]|nr:hypothetical protein [Bacteroidia bacterium]